MHAEPQIHSLSTSARRQQPLGAFVSVAAVVALVLAVFWPTTASMVDIWRRSDTFQHCFVVIPIALWLVWGERDRLAATSARPWWPGLILVAALGAAWTLGVLASAQVVSHFAMIGLIAAAVITTFGVAWARILAFPLLFMIFAVPFGEALVPTLMEWTADFTVAALRLSGVPVYRETTHFVIPSGQWSVIEACSGIKFLIASLMAGSLYAWLMYRSPGRRIAFLGASIAVPLVANWLRAYAIVMLGHLSNNRLMTNDDHIVFGWVLFGVIMLTMYWVGARWRQDEHATAPQPRPQPAAWDRTVIAGAGASMLLVATWPPIADALLKPAGGPDTAAIAAPAARNGWQLSGAAMSEWKPELEGPAATQTWVFERGPQRVELVVAMFRHQTQASQLAASINQVVRSTNLRWKQVARGSAEVSASAVASAALPPVVRSGELRGPRPGDHLLVWNWYWSGQRATTSDVLAKLDLARARLLRRPDTALWIAAAAPMNTDGDSARRALQEFARDMGPSLAVAFQETASR